MVIPVQHNNPDALTTGNESVEFTFCFQLDGTRSVESVCANILSILEYERIPGVEYPNTFRSPFAKLYDQ